MAERSNARVCKRLLAGIVGSIPSEGMDVCVVCGRGIIDMKKEDIKVHN